MPKSQRDALLILYFGIDRSVDKRDVDALVHNRLVEPKPGGGWIVNSRGRAIVRAMK